VRSFQGVARGKIRLVTAFLSHSSANRGFAAKLRKELGKRGVALWRGEGAAAGSSETERLKEGIRSASDLLLLVGPRDGKEEQQRLTWGLVLESAWDDKSKRLIPILLHETRLPAFVLSAFSMNSMDGAHLPVVRVRDESQAAAAAEAVIEAIRRESRRRAEASPPTRSPAIARSDAASVGEPKAGYPVGGPTASVFADDPGPVDSGGGGKAGLSVSVEPSADADAGTKEGLRFGRGVSVESSADADAHSKADYAARLDDIAAFAKSIKPK
jgi:TIR domain